MYDQFGRNYIVARAHIERVLKRSPGKSSDGLWDLARDMRRCQMTLSQMGYEGDMSTTDNLLRIQQLLPVYQQGKWANTAHALMEARVVPNFTHMTDFVEVQAKVASNVFGKNVGHSQSTMKPKSSSFIPKKQGRAFATQGRTSNPPPKKDTCPCCKIPHSLQGCRKFKEMTQKERFEILKKNGRCFNCFKLFHLAKDCNTKPMCERDGCSRKHHTLMHFDRSEDTRPPSQHNGAGAPSQQNGAGHAEQPTQMGTGKVECHHTVKGRNDVCLRVLPVKVHYGTKEVVTWALLDDGSDTSLCEEGLVEELGLSGETREYKLTTVNGSNSSQKGKEVCFSIQGLNSDEEIEMERVWTVQNLPVSTKSIPRQENVDQWPHLKDIELSSADRGNIRLLIGSDTPDAFWVQEERRGHRKDPYAIRTPLGWTVMGPSTNMNHGLSFSVHHISMEENLTNQVKRFWEMESCPADEKLGESVEDRKARAIMEKTVKFENGHYQLGLPWRESPPALPNNQTQANSRLQCLKKRLQRNESLHVKYNAVMAEYLRKGYAQEVDKKRKSVEGSTWYLPHHPVLHPLKPEKVRIVFDCAAQFEGVFL